MAGEQMTREEILELIGDPQEFLRDSELYDRSVEYVSQHWDELYAKYQGQFIAVRDGQLITHGSEQGDVLQYLDDHGIPRRMTLVEYLTPDDVVIMLLCR
jgi:hypothetical protein